MSRFKVLKIDHFDPVLVGKRNRWIFYLYSITIVILLFLFNIHGSLKDNAYTTMSVIMPVVIVIFILLIWRLKRTIKKIKTIGEIEFTTSCIKKLIGDSLVEYNYQMIKVIEVSKHIPATSIRESKTGYFSYILKIIFQDSLTESLVIADRSIDRKKDISILETLKTLKRICSCEIKLP
jgi:hypothetical protein